MGGDQSINSCKVLFRDKRKIKDMIRTITICESQWKRFPAGSISSSSCLRYIVCGDANSSVFVSHASFPRITTRKWLLKIVYYFLWVFGEDPVAVHEYRCQDIESERKRCAGYDLKIDSLSSPKTQTRYKTSEKTYHLDKIYKILLFLSQRRPQ